MRSILAILFLLLQIPSFSMDKIEAERLFFEANAAFEAEAYSDAYATYDSIAIDYRSFELCFNAGNAAFKAGMLGESILYYERARKINPTADDLLVNLAIANEKVADRIPELKGLGVENIWSAITATDRLGMWTWIAILGNVIGFGLLMIWLFSRSGGLKRALFWIGAIMIFLAMASYVISRVSYSRIQANTEAVIMSPKIDVKNGPSENGSNAFVLHEGTKVKIQTVEGAWTEIRIANGQVGWVKNNAIEGI